jgi:hypothetical protein
MSLASRSVLRSHWARACSTSMPREAAERLIRSPMKAVGAAPARVPAAPSICLAI